MTTAEVSITLPANVTDTQIIQAAKAVAASALAAAPDATIVSTIVSTAKGRITFPEGKETEVLAGIRTVVCAGQDNCVVVWVTTGARRLSSDRRLAEETYEVTQTVTVSSSLLSLSPSHTARSLAASTKATTPLRSC